MERLSPAKRYLMMALSYLSDAQEEMGTSEDDRNLVEEIDQAKTVIISVMEKIPTGWSDQENRA